jgi:hypothetical protein
MEHCIELRHKIDFNETTDLAKTVAYTDRFVKEAIKLCLHPNNFNRVSRLMLSQAWHPLINILEKVKQHSDEQVQRDARLSNRILDRDWREGHLGRGRGDGWLADLPRQHWLGCCDVKRGCNTLSTIKS